MKCPVCDVLLTDGECAECYALTEALSALREEQLPPLVVKLPRRGRVVYPWIAAAAAAVLMLAFPHLRHTETVPVLKTSAPVPVAQPEVMPAKAEPLKIKILTPDPNVVIYWLIQPTQGQPKEGE